MDVDGERSAFCGSCGVNDGGQSGLGGGDVFPVDVSMRI